MNQKYLKLLSAGCILAAGGVIAACLLRHGARATSEQVPSAQDVFIALPTERGTQHLNSQSTASNKSSVPRQTKANVSLIPLAEVSFENDPNPKQLEKSPTTQKGEPTIPLATVGGESNEKVSPTAMSSQQLVGNRVPVNNKAPTSGPPFVLAIGEDNHSNYWIGSESNGIWRRDNFSKGWRQFTVKDGLGDDNGYAIACDHLGRMWVGHLNHGVSVYNGSRWQNYDVVGGVNRPDSLSGPIGGRVFSIKVCPTNGDVWIATEAGLTRYSEKHDTWQHYTTADGLPTDQINALCFDEMGNLWIGTACSGIAVGMAQSDYRSWTQIHGPNSPTTEPTGDGLPSNLINDILVLHVTGEIYVATPFGLACSSDKGKTWRYVRGLGWDDKVRDSINGAPVGWKCKPGAILTEDYVTSLSEDELGNLYVGYRTLGWTKFGIQADGTLVAIENHMAGRLVVFPPFTSSESVCVGTYGSGAKIPPFVGNTSSSNIPLPQPASPPTLPELNDELASLTSVPPTKQDAPLLVSLDDDWLTQGEWIGRYGRYWCAISSIAPRTDESAYDYIWGAGPEPVKYKCWIGPHHGPGDSIRYFVGALYSDQQREIEIPPVYMDSRVSHGYTTPKRNRRDATWDDHGEVYPHTFEGPDIYCSVEIPSGLFVLSFYEVNYGGHKGENSLRDFPISATLESDSTVSASTRATNFWNGVYKRFLVRGPDKVTVKLARNYSVDTTVAGVFLDLPDQRPPPYFESVEKWQERRANKQKMIVDLSRQWNDSHSFDDLQFNPCNDEWSIASEIMANLDMLQDWNPSIWAANHHRAAVEVARLCQANTAQEKTAEATKLYSKSLYEAGLFSGAEAAQMSVDGLTTRKIEKGLKWDHSIPAYSGRGFKTVTDYLAAHPEINPATTQPWQ
jgi:Two component regulator propeller